MTNTETPAPTFTELVQYDLAAAQRAYDTARAKLAEAVNAEGFADLAYAIEWYSSAAVRAQFRVTALTVAAERGEIAFVEYLGRALSESPFSSSAFANARVLSEAEQARSLLYYWRKTLSPAALQAFTERIC